MKISLFILLAVSISTIIGNTDLGKIDQGNSNSERPIFCVLKHTPGVKWVEGTPFQEQPGVVEHVKYLSQQ